jgi:hypothetical protein
MLKQKMKIPCSVGSRIAHDEVSETVMNSFGYVMPLRFEVTCGNSQLNSCHGFTA